MVAKIKKIYLIASNVYQEKILSFLYNLGTVEVVDLKEGEIEEKEKPNLDYQLAKIKFAIDFLNKYQKKEKVKLSEKIEKMISPKIILTKEELGKIVKETHWQEIVDKVEKLEIKLNNLLAEIKNLQEEREKIYPWKDLKINLKTIQEIKSISFVAGKVSSLNWLNFLKNLEEKIKLVEVIKVSQEEKYTYCLIIFHREKEKEIEKILEKYQFEKIEIPLLDVLPEDYFKKIEDKIEILELELKIIERKIIHLRRELDRLKIIFDWLNWQKEKEEIREKFAKTSFTFSILAWVVEESFPRLKNGLEKITKEFVLVEKPIKEDEAVPVFLKNKEFISDFETVTNVYGVPKYHEPDPTPFLMPFFIVFFAICLSDAGYGLILTIISLIIINLFKLSKSSKKFFRLFLWLGIMTIFVGALFGSWFGIELETLPDFLKPIKEFLIKIKIIDPIKNPLQLLFISLFLGVLQILAGLMVNMYWKIKNKMVLDGILDNFPWIFLIVSFLIFIGSSSKLLPISFYFSKSLIFAGMVLVVLTQGRKQKNIFLKIPAGILSLYGLVGYLSDTLSYSRLLALGLATSIIGMVINLIAKIFMQMIPTLGFILAIFVLIIGHIFNIGINALGGFIHSARLQFVEFFPKFMEGGGKRFKPFKKEGKYIQLITNN